MATDKPRVSPANKFVLRSGKSEIKAQVPVSNERIRKSAKYSVEIMNTNDKYHSCFKERKNKKQTQNRYSNKNCG